MASGKKRMTQVEVVNYLVDRTSLDRRQAKQFFEDLANLAASEVQSGGEFVLPGFGKLVRSDRKAREGRNPATGQTIQIPAKTTVKFRIGKSMKDAVLYRGGRKDLEEAPFTAGGTPITVGGDPVTDPD